MDTEALDGLVNEKNWHDGIGGALIFAATVLGDGWLDQAADELAILKEKESDNRKGWDDCYEVNTHLRAELDEALELAEEGWGYASPYFQEKWSFKERLAELKAKAHPERK